MRAAYVGAEGDHVEMRMAGRKQAAFEPGVNHLQGCSLAELFGVRPPAQREQAG